MTKIKAHRIMRGYVLALPDQVEVVRNPELQLEGLWVTVRTANSAEFRLWFRFLDDVEIIEQFRD